MDINLNIKTFVKYFIIALFAISFISSIETIWNCGYDFGYNFIKAILSLI